MKRLLLLASVLVFSMPIGMGTLADTGGEPPIVTVLNSDFNDVESISVMVGESFMLFGTAIGESPLYYFWYTDVLVGSGQILNYVFQQPGEYTITLEVVDVNGLSGYDSVLVTVEGSTISTENVTWGGIKTLFR